MKILKLLAAGIILFLTSSAQAQISVSLNLGTPHAHIVRPAWVPSDCVDVDYYYLPDIEAYYDVNATMFVYLNDGNWIRSRYLPREYRNYDLYRGHKVVLNGYHGSRPYTYYDNHCANYNNNGGYYRRYNDRRYSDRYDGNRRYSNNRRYAENYRNYDRYDNQGNNNGHGCGRD